MKPFFSRMALPVFAWLLVSLSGTSARALVLTNYFNDYPPDLQCGQLWTNQGVVLHFAPTVVQEDGPVSYCNFAPIPGSPELWPCRLVLDFSQLKFHVTRIEIDTYIKTGALWLSASANGSSLGAVTNASSENQYFSLNFDLVYPDSAVIYANQAYVYGLRLYLDDSTPPPQAPWQLRLRTQNVVYWAAGAVSADASRAFALGNASPNGASAFYVSTNSGAGWRNCAAPPAIWHDLAASTNGERLIAVATTGQIFSSTNAGTDWVQCTNAPKFHWLSVAVSGDGSHITAGSVAVEPYPYDPSQPWPPLPAPIKPNGSLFTSTNFGLTWRSNNLPVHAAWGAIASSLDGSRLVATGGPLGLYRSDDGGQTWAYLGSPLEYAVSVVCSADGTRLFASGLDNVGNNVWAVSTDSGRNWSSKRAPDGGYGWPYLASSADGLKLTAIDSYAQPIFTSADAGVRWTRHASPAASWCGVASSAGGSRLMALALYGDIYTWEFQPALKATVEANGGLVISWASTPLADGFELEHKSVLDGPTWVPVNGLIHDDGTNRYIPFGVSAGPHYFRLRK